MNTIIELSCGDVLGCQKKDKVDHIRVNMCIIKMATFHFLGAYTTHQLVVRMALTSYDQIPEQLAPYCYVEFTMPATQVSHVTVRSVSVQDSDSDDPPEKYVRYLARHEYRYVILVSAVLHFIL